MNVKWKSGTVLALAVLLAPLILSAVWCPLAYRVFPQPTGLKVMTYNIHEGVDVYNRLNLDAILATIKEWDPDILFLQEVDTGCLMTGSVDQARWLAVKLNMHLAVVTSRDHMWQGDAILSKYPIVSSETILLVSESEVDTCLKATININGRTVTVFNVHLTVMGPEDRRVQADTALPYVTSTPGLKIWAGDFNIDAYTENATDLGILAEILSHFNDTFSKAPITSRFGNLTCPSWAPEERIDYIFVSPEIAVLQHGTLQSLASDHLPVVAQLQLPPSSRIAAAQAIQESTVTLLDGPGHQRDEEK